MSTAGGSFWAPYLPMELLQRWSDAGSPPQGLTFEAVTLIVDIADSTGLTDRYIGTGPNGAEQLGGVLSDYFAEIASIVYVHGGIVARIAGDAVIALWPTAHDAGQSARSALAAAALARDNRAQFEGGFTHRLALDVGQVSLSILGSEEGRRFALVSGQPLHAMAPGGLRGEPGELCVAPSVLEMANSKEGIGQTSGLASRGQAFPAAVARSFVPPTVLSNVEAGEVEWLAEFRYVSVVYVGLTGLSEADIRLGFEIVDSIARQSGVAVWDVVDEDKGVVVKIGFGLPPFATEIDALSAVEVAWRIERALADAGFSAGVGVATGRAFCGEVGNQRRREHIAVGPVMNYGARLMQAAWGCVLLDRETAGSAISTFDLSEPIQLGIKGRARPLEARRLIGRPDPEAMDWRPVERVSQVGRSRERDAIDARILALVNGPSTPIVVRGEPGVGKSLMLDQAAVEGGRLGALVLTARGARSERSTAFHVFRQVLAGLVSPGAERPRSAVVLERVRGLIAPEGADARLDLLEDIYPCPGPNALNEGLSGTARRAILEDLAVRAFHRGTLSAPCLLIVDDLQWVDMGSLNLLSVVSERCPRVLTIAAERTESAGASPTKRQLTNEDLEVTLDRLDRTDTSMLICDRLGLSRLPARLASYIYDRSGGLPLHAEQLALSLVERGLIASRNGRCELMPGALTGDSAPATLRGVITQRIDRLDPYDRITAKVASVIGVRFEIDRLASIHPGLPEVDRLASGLRRLVSAGFLEELDHGRYAFRQSLFRETLYDLMPRTQRAPLHAAIARSVEKQSSEIEGISSAELAWHWEQAGETHEAIDRRLDAAAYALRAHAVGDVLDHAAYVEHISRETKQPPTTAQRVRLDRIWADAFQEEARFEEAGRRFRTCATYAGIKIPSSGAEKVASLVVESLGQMATRAGFVSRSRGASSLQRDRLAAHIHMRLAEHAYFANDRLGLMQAALASLNHAERSDSAAEMIVGYAGLAVGLGVAGLAKPARAYADRAVRLAGMGGGKHDQGLAHLMATVALFHGGDWAATADHAGRGAADFKAVGDEFRRQTCTVLLAFTQLARGDRPNARRLLAGVPDAHADIEAASVRAWTAACRATLDLTDDRPSTNTLEGIEISLADPLNRADRLVCLGPLAELRLLAGDRVGALSGASEALEILKEKPPAPGICFVSLPRIVEVCIALEQFEMARAALKATLAFARSARVARPHARYAAGRLSATKGAKARASAHWRVGLFEAKAMGMPREAELCERALRGEHQLSHLDIAVSQC